VKEEDTEDTVSPLSVFKEMLSCSGDAANGSGNAARKSSDTANHSANTAGHSYDTAIHAAHSADSRLRIVIPIRKVSSISAKYGRYRTVPVWVLNHVLLLLGFFFRKLVTRIFKF
jgi:hypothetical protein